MTLLSNYVPILNLAHSDNAKFTLVCASNVGSVFTVVTKVVLSVANVKSVGIAYNPHILF